MSGSTVNAGVLADDEDAGFGMWKWDATNYIYEAIQNSAYYGARLDDARSGVSNAAHYGGWSGQDWQYRLHTELKKPINLGMLYLTKSQHLSNVKEINNKLSMRKHQSMAVVISCWLPILGLLLLIVHYLLSYKDIMAEHSGDPRYIAPAVGNYTLFVFAKIALVFVFAYPFLLLITFVLARIRGLSARWYNIAIFVFACLAVFSVFFTAYGSWLMT
jgi:hypothetical protein